MKPASGARDMDTIGDADAAAHGARGEINDAVPDFQLYQLGDTVVDDQGISWQVRSIDGVGHDKVTWEAAAAETAATTDDAGRIDLGAESPDKKRSRLDGDFIVACADSTAAAIGTASSASIARFDTAGVANATGGTADCAATGPLLGGHDAAVTTCQVVQDDAGFPTPSTNPAMEIDAVQPAAATSSTVAAESLVMGGFNLGDRVAVQGYFGTGTIRFVGLHHNDGNEKRIGPRIGVEFDQQVGKNSGTIGGHRYFSCKPNHGLLVKPARVRSADVITSENVNATAPSNGSSGSSGAMDTGVDSNPDGGVAGTAAASAAPGDGNTSAAAGSVITDFFAPATDSTALGEFTDRSLVSGAPETGAKETLGLPESGSVKKQYKCGACSFFPKTTGHNCMTGLALDPAATAKSKASTKKTPTSGFRAPLSSGPRNTPARDVSATTSIGSGGGGGGGRVTLADDEIIEEIYYTTIENESPESIASLFSVDAELFILTNKARWGPLKPASKLKRGTGPLVIPDKKLEMLSRAPPELECAGCTSCTTALECDGCGQDTRLCCLGLEEPPAAQFWFCPKCASTLNARAAASLTVPTLASPAAPVSASPAPTAASMAAAKQRLETEVAERCKIDDGSLDVTQSAERQALEDHLSQHGRSYDAARCASAECPKIDQGDIMGFRHAGPSGQRRFDLEAYRRRHGVPCKRAFEEHGDRAADFGTVVANPYGYKHVYDPLKDERAQIMKKQADRHQEQRDDLFERNRHRAVRHRTEATLRGTRSTRFPLYDPASLSCRLAKVCTMVSDEQADLLARLQHLGFAELQPDDPAFGENTVAVYIYDHIYEASTSWTPFELTAMMPALIKLLLDGRNVEPVPNPDSSVAGVVADCAAKLTVEVVAAGSPPPVGLGVDLRDYQQMGIAWMQEREQPGTSALDELWTAVPMAEGEPCFYCAVSSQLRRALPARSYGGVLADEMGLGKTITMLGLVLSSPPTHPVLPLEHVLNAIVESSGADAKALATAGHTALPKDEDDSGMLGRFIGRSDAEASKPAIKRAFRAKPSKRSNATVIVVPSTLLPQWSREIRNRTNLSVITIETGAHATAPNTRAAVFTHDVVLVSMSLLIMHSAPKRPNAISLFNNVLFHRIIVDESHFIKNPTTTSCIRVTGLHARSRWCVTGTPIGQAFHDLHGQLLFIGVAPFDNPDVFPECISKPLDGDPVERATASGTIRQTLQALLHRHHKMQRRSDGTPLVELPEKTVTTVLMPFTNPAEQAIYDYLSSRAQADFSHFFRQSPATVLSKYIHLMSVLYSVRQACSHPGMLDLAKLHRGNCEMVAMRSTGAAGAGKVFNSKGILALCAHVPAKYRNHTQDVLFKLMGGSDGYECTICLDAVTVPAVTPCGHVYCADCLPYIFDEATQTREARGRCPNCRETVKASEVIHVEMHQNAAAVTASDGGGNSDAQAAMSASSASLVSSAPPSDLRSAAQKHHDQTQLHTLPEMFINNVDSFGVGRVSTKVARLVAELTRMSNREDNSKAVVFSQWLGTLDYVRKALAALPAPIKCVGIDGSSNLQQRAGALADFESDPEVKVFLLSIRSGGVGINLTSANHLFILDACLNPAMEAQAINRIHRIGQARAVVVKKYAIAGTVEERVLASRAAEHLSELSEGDAEEAAAGKLKDLSRVTRMKDLFGL